MKNRMPCSISWADTRSAHLRGARYRSAFAFVDSAAHKILSFPQELAAPVVFRLFVWS